MTNDISGPMEVDGFLTEEVPAPAVETPFTDEILETGGVWKKNAIELYESIITFAMPWPSLTLEFMSDVKYSPDSEMQSQRLLAGTRTAGSGDELLRILQLDRTRFKIDSGVGYDKHKEEYGGYATDNYKAKLHITHKINHSVGEINRARAMPQNPNLISTFASNGRVYFFDRTKYSSDPATRFHADMILDHHKEEGFGLSWNRHVMGQLLTGADGIALWDVTNYSAKDKTLRPIKTWQTTMIVNEVEWHPHKPNMFAAASDDCTAAIYNVNERKPSLVAKYTSELNCVKFSPGNEHLMATGSLDNTVQLWDLRNLDAPVKVLSGHSDAITTMQWSPYDPQILASGSGANDRSVIVWDVTQDSDSSCMLFRHVGHKAEINDVAWNPAKQWEVASVASDNTLHVWQPASSIVQAL